MEQEIYAVGEFHWHRHEREDELFDSSTAFDMSNPAPSLIASADGKVAFAAKVLTFIQ